MKMKVKCSIPLVNDYMCKKIIAAFALSTDKFYVVFDDVSTEKLDGMYFLCHHIYLVLSHPIRNIHEMFVD